MQIHSSKAAGKSFQNLHFLQFLEQQGFYHSDDLSLLLKVLERKNDPLNTVFEELRKAHDFNLILTSGNFKNLICSVKSLDSFKSELVLFLH